MKRTTTIFFALIAVVIEAAAQRLVAEAPSNVGVGEQFRLTFTVNTQDVRDFSIGDIPDELDVLMGPSTSSQSSFQMVNGHTSSTSSITYTYILSATKEGTYTIPAAKITAGGKQVTSNTLTITVSASMQQGSSGGQRRQGNSMRQAGTAITGSDLFIRVSANKRRVYEQEPILLTYKVYTLVDLTQLQGKMPDLKGFHTQEIQLPQQKSFKVETLNGRPYRTVVWSQYVMFPQVTGELEIPSITFDGVVIQQNCDIDPFEAFFNGGSGYVEVKKKIVAPGLKIQVEPLPKRPVNFSGGVGSFSISAQLDKQKVKANDPITLRVIVNGRGNMKLIKTPTVDFPKDFDTYDPKVTDKTKLTSNGVEGNMVYDFLAVPRHQGKYEIPPVEFVYYDTDANEYKTVKTEAFTLDVEKGSGEAKVSDFTGQEELKQLNKDIRYIKTGAARQHELGDSFFGSALYWGIIAALSIAFVSLFVIFRQRAIANSNIDRQRGRKANKVATRRLKKANKLMEAGNNAMFYDEVLRTLWGYVGDKLNIPVENLSRENISQCLSERSVGEDTIQLFIGALDECEFERYAPGDAKGNMRKTFDAAMTAIMKIEETMKKKSSSKASHAVGVLMLVMFMPAMSHAVTKANADSAYAKQQYQQAIKDYEELLQQGISAELYYNLGNAYYRVDNITKAVLNYERALLLAPGDGDIRFNLQMAREKTIDKITPEPEMFFVTWYHSLVNLTSVDGWARVALVAFALAIVLALCYIFANRVLVRKFGFFGAFAFVVIFIMSNIFAHQQKNTLLNRTGAIVVSSAISVKSTPSKSGTDLFILHEGTKVEITDSTMHDWREIKVADGKVGWVETSQLEVI